MSAAECSMCLENILTDPVCIPCGHIFCSGCLKKNSELAFDEGKDTAACPNCRKPYVISEILKSPLSSRLYIRHFSTPSVRRVYLRVDTTLYEEDQKKISELSAQIETLKESHAEELKEKDETWRTKYEALEAQLLMERKASLEDSVEGEGGRAGELKKHAAQSFLSSISLVFFSLLVWNLLAAFICMFVTVFRIWRHGTAVRA